MEQVQVEAGFHKHLGLHPSDLCSEVTYFLIFPYTFEYKGSKEVVDRSPIMVTFRDDSIKFTEILNRYLQQNPSEKRNKKLMAFTLSRGSIINRNMTVKKLKKQLRRDSVDGLNLYVTELPEQKIKNYENKQFENECALMDFITENEFNKSKQFLFHFYLPRSSYIVTIHINPNEKVSKLIENFVQYLSNNYMIFSENKKYININVESIKDYILSDETRLSKLQNKQEKTIYQCHYFNDGDAIKVIMNDMKNSFIKIIREQFPITLIKKSQISSQKSKIMSINYQQITDYTIQNLYKIYFLSQKQKKKFEVQTKQNKICLKILEFILQPNETIMKIDSSLQKVRKLGDLKLVGYFVTQKMIFYQKIQRISQNYNFDLAQLALTDTDKNKRIQKLCQYNSEKFVKERTNELQKLAEGKYFKTSQEILPFLVYSSELEVSNPETKEVQTIYYSLNKRLREKGILNVMLKELEQNWCYKFTGILLKYLTNITLANALLYRGVNYKLEGKISDKITFKSFLSTSADKNVAINFAYQNMIKQKIIHPDRPPIPLVLFVITAASGKSIEPLSVYPSEREFLYEPYSQFRIKGIRQQDMLVPSQEDPFKKQKCRFTVYDLQEIGTPRNMPQTMNNYIIWVDDKPQEANFIYHKLISEFHYPTVLFQLHSTKDLIAWIKEKDMIVRDPTKKMIMITNMVRNEAEGRNYYAGVDAINAVNQHITPNIPIALYVGDLRSAENNMRQKQCDCNNVKIMNIFDDLARYVAQKIGVRFKIIHDEEVQQIEPSDYSNGNDGQKGSLCPIM